MRSSNPKQEKIYNLAYDQTHCSICLDSLQHPDQTTITLTQCQHAFHQTCILDAMKAQYNLFQEATDHDHIIPMQNITLEQIQSHFICPYCRQPIIDSHLLYHPTLIKTIIPQTIHFGKIQEFNKMLPYLDDINALKYYNDNSLLHLVVGIHNDLNKDERLSMATTLIQKNININGKTIQHWTPLHIAANGNDTTMIKLLLDNDAHINAQNDWTWTPLHHAVQYGHIEAIKLLIEQGADINAPANLGLKMQNGKLTPIYIAIYYQQMAALKLLIKNNANVNAKAIFDFTPLHFAALCSNHNFQQLVPENNFEPDNYKPYIDYIKSIQPINNENEQNSFGQNYTTLQTTDTFDIQLIQLFKDTEQA